MIDHAQDPGTNIASADGGIQSSEPQASEASIPQSQVNDLIKRTKMEAYERAKKEHLDSMSSNSMRSSDDSGLTPDLVRQIAAEQVNNVIQQYQQIAIGNQMAGKFEAEMESAYKKYPELKEAAKPYSEKDWERYADLVVLATGVDNAGDVMKHLIVDHPSKITTILDHAKRSPKVGADLMKNLSDTIKSNQAAIKKSTFSPEPLSQIKPSNGNIDNGQMSVADYQKLPMFRG